MAEDNPYYNIPHLINNHCMLFYELFTWYKKNHGQELKFLSDTEVTVGEKVKDRQYEWLTCVFDSVISSDICNKFNMTFKIKSFGKAFGAAATLRTTPDFYIGYTEKETLEESIKNWDYQLGESDNASTTSSWCFSEQAIYHSGDGDHFRRVKDASFAVGDSLKIAFDFIGKNVKIYHNDIEGDRRELTTDKVWIGLSLVYPQETVEMIEYKYE